MHRLLLALLLVLSLPSGAETGRPVDLHIVVADDAAPLVDRDEAGQLTGFSVEIARALCSEIGATCVFDVVAERDVLPRLVQGKADIAATGIFETRERRGRLIRSEPYYRSFSLWLGPADIMPGRKGICVAVVGGSIQEDYARRQGWDVKLVRSSSELTRLLVAGEAQAALVPMITALQMRRSRAFRGLGLAPTVLRAPELSGDISFAIASHRPQLKRDIDAALERIKRKGTYDRINSRFLPLRVS